MKVRPVLAVAVLALAGLLLAGCGTYPLTQFENQFTMPREPRTLLTPGQFFTMEVPEGKEVLITDIYVENLGGGDAVFEIQEQRLPTPSFEVRYVFNTGPDETLIINYTTGLKLGDEAPIRGVIRIVNGRGSTANILPRINGIVVDQ